MRLQKVIWKLENNKIFDLQFSFGADHDANFTQDDDHLEYEFPQDTQIVGIDVRFTADDIVGFTFKDSQGDDHAVGQQSQDMV